MQNRTQDEDDIDDKERNKEQNDFITATDFEEQVGANDILLNLVITTHQMAHQFEIEFHTKEQPAFNRQFDLLIKI